MLLQKGKAQERLQELTLLCERQRSKLAEATLRARELERLASAAKEDTRVAEDQVRQVSPSAVGETDMEFLCLVLVPSPLLRHPIFCILVKSIHHGKLLKSTKGEAILQQA